jgi:hypothetical protein
MALILYAIVDRDGHLYRMSSGSTPSACIFETRELAEKHLTTTPFDTPPEDLAIIPIRATEAEPGHFSRLFERSPVQSAPVVSRYGRDVV